MPQTSLTSNPQTPAPAYVFDAGAANFETEVLQASLKTPVLVDFWASWCGPCKSLGPILEKLADDYAGAFRLAKVDCDQEQQLAGMFGVRSIPTVVLVQNGQIANEFSGALPESQVRAFLSQCGIEPAARIDAPAALDEAPADAVETPQAAVARLGKALASEPENAGLKLDLALANARQGKFGATRAALDGLPAELTDDDRAKALAALLAMHAALPSLPAKAELTARIKRDPRDFAAQDALGVRLLLDGDAETAMQHWLAILAGGVGGRSWNDGLARKRLLDAFRIVADPALVAGARRRMSSLLF